MMTGGWRVTKLILAWFLQITWKSTPNNWMKGMFSLNPLIWWKKNLYLKRAIQAKWEIC